MRRRFEYQTRTFCQHRRASVAAALTAVALVGTAGCKPERPNPAGPGIAPEVAATTIEKVPTPKIDVSKSRLTAEQRSIPVATIGQRTLTLGELEARLAQQPEAVRAQYGTVARRREFLLNWVQFEVLADEAVRRGFDKDSEVVETLRSQMVRRFLEEEVQQGVTPESVTDDEIRAYYDANLRLYSRPASVELRHLQVADAGLAQRLHDEIVAGGEAVPAKILSTWKDYIDRYHEDATTKPQLGSLGVVWESLPPGATPAEVGLHESLPASLREAGSKLGAYEVSPVVKSEHGFHILLAVAKNPKLSVSLDEVKAQIRTRMVKRKRDQARVELINRLQQQAKVEYNDEAIGLLPPPDPKARLPKTGGKGDGHDHGGEHGHP